MPNPNNIFEKESQRPNWGDALEKEHISDSYRKLFGFVESEYKTQTVYPPFSDIMRAMALTSLADVKCVILGQDPYHEPNQAMGLAFSVHAGTPVPRSLQNIYKELQTEYGYDVPCNGDLRPWAQQGVLLLNAVLTVRAHQPASHASKGWEAYTDNILSVLNMQDRPIVYLLWGNFAKSKKALLDNPKHLILESTHPSPFSASYGFFGCGHFKTCNAFLEKNGILPIDWQIKDE